MKSILIFILIAAPFCAFSQETDSVRFYIGEGVKLHDEGDFEGAITQYNRALSINKDDALAMSEKALSLLYLKKFEEAVDLCKKVLKLKPADHVLKMTYTTYANALDNMQKPDEAVKIYDKGLKAFPDDYQLYFNKGVTLSRLSRYDEALENFNKAVTYNPQHASSHHATAHVLLAGKNNNIPALLALGRFFVLEPQGGRAQSNLPLIRNIMSGSGSIEKTGEKSITVNLDGDYMNSKNKENNFSTTDMILSLAAVMDMDDKNKDRAEHELFSEKFETVCSSLSETAQENSGFYWEYYVPYFVELHNNKYVETFTHIVFAESEFDEVHTWLNENQDKVKEFYNWTNQYDWGEN